VVSVADCELRYTRALQRYAASRTACMEMHGSLSILVVPQDDYRALAAASLDVEAARNAWGNAQARTRGQAIPAPEIREARP
jgi:hypothetical protein